MTVTKREMFELLEDTIMEYSADPKKSRAVTMDGWVCSYRTEDGRACAIGRLIDDKTANLADNSDKKAIAAVIDIMPKHVSRFPIEFLAEIQRLHDQTIFWDLEEGGLSQSGWDWVESILDNIEDGNYADSS